MTSLSPEIYNTNNTDSPKAYLIWMLFDSEFKLVPGSSGMLKVNNNANMLQTLSQLNIVMEKSGYFYAYLANESPMNVYFDDFQVSHIPGPVLEQNHYYPFGMLNPQLTTQSITKPLNFYNYNGKELQKDLNLGWLDYGWRQFDPQIGRFTTQDRFSEKYYSLSNYSYGANNPVLFIDVNGDSLMLFKNGTYVGTYDNGKKEITGYNQESTIDKNGKETFTGGQSFNFNDQEVDPQAVRNGVINKVEFVSDATVDNQMQRSGVKDHKGVGYAYAESHGGGKMDYGAQGIETYGDLNKNTFYVRGGTAYNVADYGNYLWGRGMAELGITVDNASLGAHYNNFFNGRRGRDEYSQYNFGKGTYGKPGWFDSPSDQRAIMKGHASHPKPPKPTWPTFDFPMK
jgi:RHS repeat-associated protein